MTKKNIIIAVVVFVAVVALVASGYLYWNWRNKKLAQQPAPVSATSSLQSAVDAARAITQGATQGTLPSIGGAVNPLQNKPNVNPADAANPFKSLKTNPFQ